MTARFLVEQSFPLRSRQLFVVHGQILDGVLRIGQSVRAPQGIDAPVAGVEFALLSATEGRENPALTFRYGSDAQLARWQALALGGATLELEDSPAEVCSDARAS
jgi:hypothetical protein